jgi:metal-dependent amidase/aminoacylase/carboxypeptidase family protein
LANLSNQLPKLEALYKDIHAHPELSMQETRTADLAPKHLGDDGYEVTAGVGKTGVVGLLRNGVRPGAARCWRFSSQGKRRRKAHGP